MKRKIVSLAVLVLAVSLSAFTAVHKKEKDLRFAQYYWFPLDGCALCTQSVQNLVYQSGDPALCLNIAPILFCSSAWTSFTGYQGDYQAAGMETIIDYNGLFLP